MEGKEALGRDWTSLPPDMLNLIAKKLNEISDFVRFRAVCPSWSSSTPITDFPSQFPWILENRHNLNEPTMWFYSVTANKLYTINSPKFVNKNVTGFIEAYLPVGENKQLSLLNPLSNHEIRLPSYNVDISAGESPWSMSQINRMGTSVIACRYSDLRNESKLTFYNFGQEDAPVSNIGSFNVWCSSFYLKDMPFMVEHDRSATKVIDIVTGAVAYVIPPIGEPERWMRVNIVETSGDIFRFSIPIDQPSNKWGVHRLHVSENGSRYWVKVTNISDYAFFADIKCGFLLKANESARIKANSIYFLDLEFLCYSSGLRYRCQLMRIGGCQLIRIDIETSATEVLPFSSNGPAAWFVPILHHH